MIAYLIKKIEAAEAVDSDNSLNMVDKIKYWRDSRGVHHVPKRKLSDILLNCY